MTTKDQKRKFAELTLKGTSALEAAEIALDGDTGEALRVAQEWDDSDEIQQLREDIEAEHGEGAVLPSRESVALEVLQHARRTDNEDYKTRAYKLYCDMMGYIEKPAQTVVDNSTKTINHVMRVPLATTMDDFKAMSAGQQTKLLEDAKNTN